MPHHHPRIIAPSRPVAGRPVGTPGARLPALLARLAVALGAVALGGVALAGCGEEALAPGPGRDDSVAPRDAAGDARSDAGRDLGALDGDVRTPDADPSDADRPDARDTDAEVPDARILDAGAPVPECADDDLDGDGYGTGPTCPDPDCDDANAAIHPGAVEACNGRDDDCDGALDEDLYTARCGVGACRREVPNCLDGQPNRCVPGAPAPEACNGLDDDCDGAVDEAAAETCGVGACQRPAACEAGAPVCSPGAPAGETCNGADDDCDGQVDEGQGAPAVGVRSYGADLASRHPPCDGLGQRIGPDCNAAIHRHCAAQPCQGTGFGPVENSGDTAVLTCLPPAEVVEATFATLAGQHAGCDGARQRIGPDCNAAIHRFCRGRGHVSGFGPLESGPDRISVACVGAGAEVFERPYAELATHHDGCEGTRQRIGPECNAAIHRFCAGSGFTSGFGPVENSGGTAYFTCVRAQ